MVTVVTVQDLAWGRVKLVARERAVACYVSCVDSKEPDHIEARDQTDASLLAERDKTDAELAKRQAVARTDEDEVVETA